ncbi:hypothetical protein [Ferruginibacter profundus]
MTAHSRLKFFTFLLFFLPAFISCKQKTISIQRGFYYWKSNEYAFASTENNCIKTLGIQKIYVKFFEVEFSKIFGVRPVAKTLLNSNYIINDDFAGRMEVIPVVFIKTDVLANTSQTGLDSLADNIVFLTAKKYKDKINLTNSFTELQIDCDWTASTKDKYFLLLKAIKKKSGKIISCTLRMYPYKYPELMGVPPADKVTLMCYNLNNPLENENKNSILDVAEVKKYLSAKKAYPLHLDIVLPVTSWMLCFQNNQFAGVLHNQDDINTIAKPIKPLWYSAVKDTVIDDIFLRVGDKIKYEEVSKEQLQELVALLKSNINFTATTTISFFHLDKAALNKYDNETLDHLYNHFK